jgi:hypothetical protein
MSYRLSLGTSWTNVYRRFQLSSHLSVHHVVNTGSMFSERLVNTSQVGHVFKRETRHREGRSHKPPASLYESLQESICLPWFWVWMRVPQSHSTSTRHILLCVILTQFLLTSRTLRFQRHCMPHTRDVRPFRRHKRTSLPQEWGGRGYLRSP